jgi:hypothetical protein
MNSQDAEIANKIKVLKEINTELDNYEKFLDVLVKNDSISDYSKIMEEISPNERMDVNWNMGYSAYTLYYSKILLINSVYLKLRNIDPRDHEIKDEMKRVQDFYSKIQDAKSIPAQYNSNINKEACDRMIKNSISSKDDSNVRKLKKSIPVPENVHLNWQKNLK